MSKRLVVSLVVVALALLVSSAAFAAPAPTASDAAFLASLQAPAPAAASGVLTGIDQVPVPTPMACTYQCNKCGTNKVKLCSLCNGVTSCEPCHSGTVCAI